MKKDIIYIDNDDEITSITDKVQSSESSVIALVLPKRCTVLQSTINMKILNRAAKSAKKNLVLVSNEQSLMAVAGAAGVMVAKSLDARPSVPTPQAARKQIEDLDDEGENDDEIDEGDSSDDEDYVEVDKSKSIGELSDDVITLGSDDEPFKDEENDEEEETKPNKKEKLNKKNKVPNFDSFRLKLFLIPTIVIVLIGGWYIMTYILPKVSIKITTQNVSNVINTVVTTDVKQTSVDVDKMIVPGKLDTIKTNATKTFTPTGNQNQGNKASGTVILYDCSVVDRTAYLFNGTTITLSTGTQLSSRGLIFVTTAPITITPSKIALDGSNCQNDQPAKVAVEAQNGGASFNLAPSNYVVSNNQNISGNGSAMGGGTDKIVTVVSQNDCTNAGNAILNGSTDTYKTQLQNQLNKEGFTPLLDSFAANPGAVSCSPAVGEQGSTATATIAYSSVMTGASTDGLTQIITMLAGKNLASTQSVLTTGIESATETIKEQPANGTIVFNLSSTATTGIKQNSQAIAQRIEGMKKGDAQNYIQGLPGVTAVTVSYSPFYVTTAPKNLKQINVSFVNNGN